MAINELIPAELVYEITTIDEAINQLVQNKAAFGIITSPRNELLGLISVEELSSVENKKMLVKTLTPRAAELIVVESPETLEEVVQNHTKELEVRPNLAWIVIKEQGQIRGILPRHLIITQAKRVVTRGFGIDRLEGSPLDTLFFKCKIDNERKIVNYYDPTDPPRCSKKHLMIPDE
jgi:hypothetical protein